MFKASQTLEQTILALAPAHYATPDAPNTFKELMQWWRDKGQYGAPMPVYDGGSDNTIYSTPAVNHAFRAWHDMLHIKHGLSFNKADELQVALLHAQECTGFDAQVIYSDVAGQVLYYHEYGQFVENQAAFMAHYLATGRLDYQ